MNDTVLELDLATLAPLQRAGRFDALSLAAVIKLGAELFAEHPLLHRTQPERARRLAWLIVSTSPGVNAANFQAPSAGCRADQVSYSLAELSVGMMAGLYAEARIETLTPVLVDSRVWRRMAA